MKTIIKESILRNIIKEAIENEMSTRRAKTYIYKKVISKYGGKYRDEDWSNLRNMLDEIQNLPFVNDISISAPNGGYFRDNNGHMAGKRYEFDLFLTNGETLKGNITCSFCGTSQEYESDDLRQPYNITFYFY